MSTKRGSGGAGREELSKEVWHLRKKRGITDVDVSEEIISESEGEKRAKEKKTPAAKKRKTEGRRGVMTPETSKDETIRRPFNFMSPHLGANSAAGGSEWKIAASVYTSSQTFPPWPHSSCGANLDISHWQSKQRNMCYPRQQSIHLQMEPPSSTSIKTQRWPSIIEGISLRTCLLPFTRPDSARKQSNPSSTKKANQAVSKCYDWHRNLEWYPGHTSITTQKPPKLDPTMAKSKVMLNNCQPKTADQAWSTCQAGRIAITKLWFGHEAEDKEVISTGTVREQLRLLSQEKAMENWRDITTILDKFMPDWDKPDEGKMLDVETIKADGRDASPNKHRLTS
ncbi:hypothetical protein BT69DRAFT_1304800 [Atractiella rhizophila]|nr:hypothetical protein BT69DRAFT_1304800 [Atractiella rhizophila]